jgi:hypothetical protein
LLVGQAIERTFVYIQMPRSVFFKQGLHRWMGY